MLLFSGEGNGSNGASVCMVGLGHSHRDIGDFCIILGFKGFGWMEVEGG